MAIYAQTLRDKTPSKRSKQDWHKKTQEICIRVHFLITIRGSLSHLCIISCTVNSKFLRIKGPNAKLLFLHPDIRCLLSSAAVIIIWFHTPDNSPAYFPVTAALPLFSPLQFLTCQFAKNCLWPTAFQSSAKLVPTCHVCRYLSVIKITQLLLPAWTMSGLGSPSGARNTLVVTHTIDWR